MARIGVQVSLIRYVCPKYSAIILVNKSTYYFPIEIWYSSRNDYLSVHNRFKIGDTVIATYQGIAGVGITYITKKRNVFCVQTSNLYIKILYSEYWDDKSRQNWIHKNSVTDIKELRYLRKNIPDGYLFTNYHVILRLIEEINQTDELRNKLYEFD